MLGFVFTPDTTEHPERVTAAVTGCDLNKVTAEVSYSLTNGDRVIHAYRVTILVTNVAGPIGGGLSLANRVKPGETVTGHVFVPVTGKPLGGKCSVSAEVRDGHSGKHGGDD